MSDQPQETYDTPKVANNYDSPRPWCRTPPATAAAAAASAIRTTSSASADEESYDVPRPYAATNNNNIITPSSSNSSLMLTTAATTSSADTLSLSSSSNRSSLINMPEYDIPRKCGQPQPHSPTPTMSSSSLAGGSSSAYDVPHLKCRQTIEHPSSTAAASKELSLELSLALETLAKLQIEATSSVTRLLGFVSPQWRAADKFEPILIDLKLAAHRLRSTLHDLVEFSNGALTNASHANDKNMAIKLRPLVQALCNADRLIHGAVEQLECDGWTVDVLCRRRDVDDDDHQAHDNDHLDQLMACAQTLIEDIRQTTSFVQGNATLLFKRATPSLATNRENRRGPEWHEDYEYVSMDGNKTVQPTMMKAATDMAVVVAVAPAPLSMKDKSLLLHYGTEIIVHMGHLTQAIDAFLQTVERNQPPKFFVAYGKFVVLSAYNLVAIGDIVQRKVSVDAIRKRAAECSDALSETLKSCVTKTKRAAQHFPSVTSVQEMVDSIVDVSHSAYELKLAMLQCSSSSLLLASAGNN